MNIQEPHKSLVISFKPSGEVESLHIDKFDLGFLGAKSIRRATEIIFDEKAQLWGIVMLSEAGSRENGWPGQRGFATYEQARDVEVAWLNLCRAKGVEWDTTAGADLLGEARRAVLVQ